MSDFCVKSLFLSSLYGLSWKLSLTNSNLLTEIEKHYSNHASEHLLLHMDIFGICKNSFYIEENLLELCFWSIIWSSDILIFIWNKHPMLILLEIMDFETVLLLKKCQVFWYNKKHCWTSSFCLMFNEFYIILRYLSTLYDLLYSFYT